MAISGLTQSLLSKLASNTVALNNETTHIVISGIRYKIPKITVEEFKDLCVVAAACINISSVESKWVYQGATYSTFVPSAGNSDTTIKDLFNAEEDFIIDEIVQTYRSVFANVLAYVSNEAKKEQFEAPNFYLGESVKLKLVGVNPAKLGPTFQYQEIVKVNTLGNVSVDYQTVTKSVKSPNTSINLVSQM